MKKAMVISIFCVVFLSACGNVSESTESESSSVASQTTVTAIVSAETSAKEEMDTSKTTATIKKSSQTVSETSLAKTTTKSMQPPQEQIKQQSSSDSKAAGKHTGQYYSKACGNNYTAKADYRKANHNSSAKACDHYAETANNYSADHKTARKHSNMV